MSVLGLSPAYVGSPGRRPRPSLSAGGHHGRRQRDAGGIAGATSPAFVSGAHAGSRHRNPDRWIAGATSPAFVERGGTKSVVGQATAPRIAGATSPAFVERSREPGSLPPATGSPGRRPRPSLSVRGSPGRYRQRRDRRGDVPGLR